MLFFNAKPETPELLRNRANLLEKAKKINGKTVREIDTTGRLSNSNDKGRIGQVIQVYLGKDPDNDPGADFPEAGVELKVTGLLANKTSYRAKERLVLHMIDYTKDHGIPFEESGLLNKCGTMLITTYQYLPAPKGDKPDYGSFPVVDSFVYKLSDNDIEIMRNDYNTILEKINSGHAEVISESDTEYLAACTKGPDSKHLVKQFNSSEMAKPRAFSLKPSFLTTIIKESMGEAAFEQINNQSKKPNICDVILGELYAWYGMSETQLRARFPEVGKGKGAYAMLVSKMLGLKDLENSEVFQKANIHVKTVRVEENGTIEQYMSFGAFEFCDVANTDWEDSEWHSYFSGAKFLFAFFRKKGGEYYFDKAMFYSLPEIVPDGFMKYTYNKTQETLLKGEIVYKVQDGINRNGEPCKIHSNNFVGIRENPVCHVRPHGRTFLKTQNPLPVPDKLTGYTTFESQCLWLDKKYIRAVYEGKDSEYLMWALEQMESAGNPIEYDLL